MSLRYQREFNVCLHSRTRLVVVGLNWLFIGGAVAAIVHKTYRATHGQTNIWIGALNCKVALKVLSMELSWLSGCLMT